MIYMKEQCTPAHYLINSFVFICFFLLVPLLSFGQVPSKKKLTEAEYSRWGKLENESLSPNGSWASYTMHYDSGTDTLFVMHTSTKKSYSFPNGIQGKFGGDIAFAALQPDTKLVVADLEKETRNVLSDINSFVFAHAGRLLITYSEAKTLVLRTTMGEELDEIANVVEYQLDTIGNTLSYITAYQGIYTMGTIDLKTMRNHTRFSSTNRLYSLALSEYGNGIFLLEAGSSFEQTVLHYYSGLSDPAKIFDPQKMPSFPKGYGIVTSKSFKVSEDGTRVFFGIKKTSEAQPTEKNQVEVWDSDDLWIYPKAKKENMEYYSRMLVWFTEDNRFLQVTDASLPYVQLNGSKTVALIYNPTAYAPHFKQYGEVDYYLYNLIDGSKTLFLKKQPSENYLLSFSPDGHYICYFRDENWWLYSVVTQSHYCIPVPKGVDWSSNDLKYNSRPRVYGMRGWSSDGRSLVLQDEYDVYQFHIGSKKVNKLTNGREKAVSYNLDESNRKFQGNGNYNGWAIPILDLNTDIVMWSENQVTKAQHYTLLTKLGQLVPLVNRNSRVDELLYSKNGVFIFREQTYTMAPRLVSVYKGKETILQQSNPQQHYYEWGRSELIAFTTASGKKMEGLLYYPANYEAGKTYPIVVSIYSHLSNKLHDYVNPSRYNDIGFNAKNFVLKDYFVLLPDIVYEQGETGKSALYCVTAATNAIIATGMVDPKRIGLTGHSFGGYETNYIVTQTKMFAAAVAGAGITDMVSWGFTVSKSLLIPELWRSETQQWRLGKAFHEDKEMYLRNSPLYFADDVVTPLLTWTGRQEVNLPYEQNILFYNALRRAGKKNVLLLYPDGDHVITNKDSMLDLTKRIEDWFDYYLKPTK